ncbi:MAG TPA: Na+/H+ antiporter NhaA [Saprospiraceae bacterium]|nr:Na+/H+ antiporter NhaA [Saprospiraceae bacterium]HRG22681.1 Na+/H+ antiporter NhaA [Saprospiraceae bacterium]
MNLTKLYVDFFNSEKAGGLILILVTILSLVLANSPIQNEYIHLWHIELAGHSIVHWINDGLMTLFFLLIGLELEREIYDGELSHLKNASLPIFGALGGMMVPAGLYILINIGTQTQSGAGIPMATDIAFAIGILALLGSRVPASLKVFLTALAVIDDLGAIIIIALFYTATINYTSLIISLGIFGILIILNRLKINNLIFYIIGGAVMWYFMLNSGVHATITGVLLAFAVPYRDGSKNTASYKMQHYLHKPVAFFILPLFAIANTCISINANWQHGLIQPSSVGIIIGLVCGKPLGIWLFSMIGSLLGLSILPSDLKWTNILGAGLLGGIGFTMSIFITLLAFDQDTIIDSSKIAIIISSLAAGIVGYLFLRLTLPQIKQKI